MDSEEEKRYRPTVIDAAKIFYAYLSVRDQIQPSDVAFVSGSASLSSIEKAFKLYRGELVPKIAFISIGGTYGGDKIWGVPEYEKYKERLLELGVSRKDILSDGLTTNTLAEAQAAIPFLRGKGIDLKKVILVARPFHQRRVNNTFVQQYQNQGIQFINCPSDEVLDPNNPEELIRMVREAERLYLYSQPKLSQKSPDIMKPQVTHSIVQDAVTIRVFLKNQGLYKRN